MSKQIYRIDHFPFRDKFRNLPAIDDNFDFAEVIFLECAIYIKEMRAKLIGDASSSEIFSQIEHISCKANYKQSNNSIDIL